MPIDISRLHYGTSSWSEKSGSGVFYPPGTKLADQLSYYATQFSTVEADNTYYRVPSPSLVRGRRQKTPEGFVLPAKFPRSSEHCGEADRSDASKLHLLVLRPLGAGPLPRSHARVWSSAQETPLGTATA